MSEAMEMVGILGGLDKAPKEERERVKTTFFQLLVNNWRSQGYEIIRMTPGKIFLEKLEVN